MAQPPSCIGHSTLTLPQLQVLKTMANQATTYTLICLFLSDGALFSVKLLSDATVDDLKHEVKAQRQPLLDHLAADELRLWKVGHHSACYTCCSFADNTQSLTYTPSMCSWKVNIDLTANPALANLKPDKEAQNGGYMKIWKKISNYFDAQPGKGHLSILVELPTDSDSRGRHGQMSTLMYRSRSPKGFLSP